MRIFWLLPLAFGLVPGCICSDNAEESSTVKTAATPLGSFNGPTRMRIPDGRIRIANQRFSATSGSPSSSASAPATP